MDKATIFLNPSKRANDYYMGNKGVNPPINLITDDTPTYLTPEHYFPKLVPQGLEMIDDNSEFNEGNVGPGGIAEENQPQAGAENVVQGPGEVQDIAGGPAQDVVNNPAQDVINNPAQEAPMDQVQGNQEFNPHNPLGAGIGAGLNPGVNPGVNPGANPGVNPGANPGVNPGANPGANLGAPAAGNGFFGRWNPFRFITNSMFYRRLFSPKSEQLIQIDENDPPKMRLLKDKALKTNSSNIYHHIANLYIRGDAGMGLIPDQEKGIEYYIICSNLGNPICDFNLGVLMQERNSTRSYELFEKCSNAYPR